MLNENNFRGFSAPDGHMPATCCGFAYGTAEHREAVEGADRSGVPLSQYAGMVIGDQPIQPADNLSIENI